MIQFCYKSRGAVSVFLAVILIPVFILQGVMIDGSRIIGAKNIISGAGDLAMNAALSNYSEDLNKVYGLLAMAQTPEEVQDTLQDFFEESLNAAGVSEEDFAKSLIYLEMMEGSFTAEGVEGSQIYQTEAFKQQVLEYIKFRGPVTFFDRSILSRMEALSAIKKEKEAADAQLDYESSLDDVQELFDQIKEETEYLQYIYSIANSESGQNAMLDRSKSAYSEISQLSVDVQVLKADIQALRAEIQPLPVGIDEAELIRLLNENIEKERQINEKKGQISDKENQINTLVSGVYNEVHGEYNIAKAGEKSCKKIVEYVDELKEELGKLEGKYDRWNNAIDALPDGDSKKGYIKHRDEDGAKALFDDLKNQKDGGSLEGFKNLVQGNQTFYQKTIVKIEAVTFTGTGIFEISNKSSFIGKASAYSSGANFMSGEYNDTRLSLDGAVNTNLEDVEFVKNLKEKYCKPNTPDETTQEKGKEVAENDLEGALKEYKDLLLSEDVEGKSVDKSGEIPSKWLAQSEADSAPDSDISAAGGIDSKTNRKNAAKNTKKQMEQNDAQLDGITELWKKISDKADDAADAILLTEYVIGMFSCYTSDIKEGEEVGEPLSLSRDSLKEHKLYQAEVEYILWGNSNAVVNVGISKALIFTINLIFNMGFAFTNPELRKQASLISAAFPVGPLIQSAIMCALQAAVATVETVKNMRYIMGGYRVPVVKLSKNWSTWFWKPYDTLPDAGSEPHPKETGVSYEEYLWIFVCTGMIIPFTQPKMLARMADCIELNMKDGDESFLKDKYTMVQVEAKVKIDTFFLPKLKGLGYVSSEVDDETFAIPYLGLQGY